MAEARRSHNMKKSFLHKKIRGVSIGVAVAFLFSVELCLAGITASVDHMRITVYYTVPAGITVSGTAYTDEGSTTMGSGRTVRIKVNGAGTYSTSTAADGTYSIADVTIGSASDVVTAYLDGASEDAITVTKAADTSTNITGLDLYQDRVIVRHEDSGPITNANLGQYDSDDDADIPFSSNSNALTVATSTSLYVWSGKTYTPGGTITTNSSGGDFKLAGATSTIDTASSVIGGDIVLNATSTLKITGSVTVNGGDITTAGSATITNPSGTPTVTLNGTGTIGGGSGSITLYNLSLGATTAGTSTLGTAITVSSTLTVASGHTLDVSSSNYGLSVAGNFANSGTFTPRSGTVTLNGANQTLTGTTSFYNLTKNTTSTATLTFPASATTTITNTLNLSGAASNLLSLRSSTTSTQWKVDPQGTRTLSYLDVRDSNNTNATAIETNGLNITDSTNNTNWTFDYVAPTVSSVSASTANGSYKAGDTVSIQVLFSEAVTVTGTPQLTLETGDTDRAVDYASGSASSTLTFTYTVQSGDTSSDLDYATTTSLALNSGTIADAAANNATLTLAAPAAANSLGANKAIIIDTTVPVISSATPATSGYATNVTASSSIAYTLSEAVASGTVVLTRTSGTADASSPHTCTLAGTALATGAHTLNLSDTTNGCTSDVSDVVSGTVYSIAFNATDAAGNAATAVTNTSITFDNTAPTVSTLSPLDDAASVSITPTLILTFSEAVTATSSKNIVIKKASDDSTIEAISVTGGLVSGSGGTTITVTPSVALSNATPYYITIDSGAFNDVALNAYAGIASATTWNFTTVASADAGYYNPFFRQKIESLKVAVSFDPETLSVEPSSIAHLAMSAAVSGRDLNWRELVLRLQYGRCDEGLYAVMNSSTGAIRLNPSTLNPDFFTNDKASVPEGKKILWNIPLSITPEANGTYCIRAKNENESVNADTSQTARLTVSAPKETIAPPKAEDVLTTPLAQNNQSTPAPAPTSPQTIPELQTYLINHTKGPATAKLKAYVEKNGTTDTIGPLTKLALKEWQSANNIPATGFWGPLTKKAMGEAELIVPSIKAGDR